MREISVEETTQLNSVRRGFPDRRSTGPFDFGDQQTVGCCLKTDPRLPGEQQFGTYYGIHKIGYVVAVIKSDETISSGEVFATLQELHKRWTLD